MSNLSSSLDQVLPTWRDWIHLTRLDKPIGSYLLLWPTLWALWVAAEGIPDWQNVVIFTLGTFLMRSAGCAINDYADRHIDKHVKRTANRPLTQGRISEREALIGFALICLMSFALVLLTNWLTIGLSLIGLVLAVIYPFMKRHTHMPQVFLGAAFSWGIPMAFASQADAVPAVCWLLFIAKLAWTVGYDTIYAMVDRDDDLKIGVKSTAILFGDLDVTIIAILYGCAHFCLLMVAGQLEMHWSFWIFWLAGAGFMAWQIYSIRSRDRAHCFSAFRQSHYYGILLLSGFILGFAVS